MFGCLQLEFPGHWLAGWIRQECSSMSPSQLPRQLIDKPTQHGDSPNYMALSILNKLGAGNRCSGIRWRLAIWNELWTGSWAVWGDILHSSVRHAYLRANRHWPFVGCARFQADRFWCSALGATLRSQTTSRVFLVGSFDRFFCLRSSPVSITPPMTHKVSFIYRLRNWLVE